MDNFAFIIHPINPKRDVERKFPLLGKYLPVSAINFLSRLWPPVYISHIEGIKSQATNKEIEGWFVACPFTPQVMMSLSHHEVYRKIIKTGQLAQKHGAKILGLGAFTSVVGDGGGMRVEISKDRPVFESSPQDLEPQVGGTLVMAVSAEPENLNYYTSTSAAATRFLDYIYEQLLDYDYETWEFGRPVLAESYSISEDGKTFRFKLYSFFVFIDSLTLVDFMFNLLKMHERLIIWSVMQ